MENNQEIKDESLNNDGEQKDFQFYKENLQSSVKEYLSLDDQIKALNKAVKERRDRKKKLSESILSLMKQFEINNMNTSNGKLVYSVTKTKEPLTRKSLHRTLNIYFGSSDKANELSKFVMENRKQIEKVQLKRKIFKTKE
jgi:hypothetical protein